MNYNHGGVCIIDNLRNFSPLTAEVSEPVRKFTSSTSELTWNNTYKTYLERVKTVIK